MFDKIIKIILILVAVVAVFLLWLGLDSNTDEYDDPNIVSIDYECNKLNEYDVVPKEVIEECQQRNIRR